MAARIVVFVALSACHAQPTNAHGDPKEWSIERSGDRCTVVELGCATCTPRDYPCPSGATLDHGGKLRAEGGACLFVAGPCPPGSTGMTCGPEPDNLHVACP